MYNLDTCIKYKMEDQMFYISETDAGSKAKKECNLGTRGWNHNIGYLLCPAEGHHNISKIIIGG